MPVRTQLFQQLPWAGGLDTTTDISLLDPQKLAQADNIAFGTRPSRKPRGGMNLKWDTATTDNIDIYGLHEFWFGAVSKLRRIVSLNENGIVRRYSAGGTAIPVPVDGKPWIAPLDEVSSLTFNNRMFFAVNNSNNTMKYWDGQTSTSFVDVPNIYNQKLFASGRSSVGTTRTLVLDVTAPEEFKGLVGDDIIVSLATGPNASYYNGTWTVLTVTTTNQPNDTITFEAAGALNEVAFNDAALTVDGIAPKASILREHLGRIWTNDKSNLDRIHFSGSFNHTQWLGFGDSGSMDIGIGDGDPGGVIAISPAFKGEIFVAKRTKLYRIRGFTPEDFSVELVSSGVGCISHNSFALIDQEDMVFVSEKGIHSISATSNFGDFSGAYLSQDIQRTFLNQFSRARLKYCKAVYNPELNSLVFAFTDLSVGQADKTNTQTNNALWLYNMPLKAWYRWPDTPCQSMILATDGDKKRVYTGSHIGRITKTEMSNTYDINVNGTQMSVEPTVKTGQIVPDGNLYSIKGFKRFILYYKAETTHNIQIQCKIDNIPLDEVNSFTMNNSQFGTLLGVNFVLGQSLLGGDASLFPYNSPLDGYGRSIQITIKQTGINERVEIFGYAIEWEPAGTSPEVR